MTPPRRLIPVRRETALNGEDTLVAGGVYIHSRFDPGGEARRFLQTLTIPLQTRSVILLEPGLGYLGAALAATRPDTRVFCLHLMDIPGTAVSCTASWQARGDESLADFLRRCLDPLDIADLVVLRWEPAARVLGPAMAELESELKSALELARSELVTAAYFGRRWLDNAVRNASRPRLVSGFTFDPGNAPVLLVAPGPSLEGRQTTLARLAQGSIVIAVSSALTYLRAAGIMPDLVVHSDGGFWGARHLDHAGAGPLVCHTWESALPPSVGNLCPLSTNGVGERFLNLGEGSLPRIPEAATVAATAILLAQGISAGPRILAGFDLCSRDLQTHARPHRFESVLAPRACRTLPGHTQAFSRLADARRIAADAYAGFDLLAYAQWFRAGGSRFSRTFRLFPRPADIGVPAISPPDAQEMMGGPKPVLMMQWEPEASARRRRLMVREAIKGLSERVSQLEAATDLTGDSAGLGGFLALVDYPALRRARSSGRDLELLRTSAFGLLRRLERYVSS